MTCSPAEHALCDLITAVSEKDLVGNVFAHLVDAGDRGAVTELVDALSLLDAGQMASDERRWHVALLRLHLTAVVLPRWWPQDDPGHIVYREFIIGDRVQRVAIRAGTR
jgi:hypothetical protein